MLSRKMKRAIHEANMRVLFDPKNSKKAKVARGESLTSRRGTDDDLSEEDSLSRRHDHRTHP